MEIIIAIGICVGFGALVLTPIVKKVITVEKYDDSKWFIIKKEFEEADRKLNSKEAK